MRKKAHVGIGILVLVVAAAGGLVGLTPPWGSSAARQLTNETTLAVLQGDVWVQRPGGPLEPVTADIALRSGDRVKTGPDSYATVTYFEGSTTSLDPDTEIIIARLDALSGRGANISFMQEIGYTWNRVERLAGPESRFGTTTVSAVAFVRGTQYGVHVAPSQLTTVVVLDGTVVVEAAGGTVALRPGFRTSVALGQQPSPPVGTASAQLGVRVEAASEPSSTPTSSPDPRVPPTPTPEASATATPVPTVEPLPTEAPTAKPTSTPSPTATPRITKVVTLTPTSHETTLVDLINESRQERGVPPLQWDPELAHVAREHSRDMVTRGFFDHVNPDGEDIVVRLLKEEVSGYRRGMYWGENLSIDHDIAGAHAHDMAEPLIPGNHHANIVDPRFGRIGASVITGAKGELVMTVLFLPP